MFAPFSSIVAAGTKNCSCSARPGMSATPPSSSPAAAAAMNQAGDEKPSPPPPLAGSRRTTVSCILCGGVQIYPGPRYENHLVNEHGAVFDVDFLIELSLFKQKHGRLPDLSSSAGDENGNGGVANDATHETGTPVKQLNSIIICVLSYLRINYSPYSSRRRSNRYTAQVGEDRGVGDGDGGCTNADGG